MDLTLVKHPCHGMTKTQRAVFERIAVNLPPRCSPRVLDALLEKGLIERGLPERRQDKLGVFYITTFFVPTHVHIQWCEWCAANEALDK